MLDYLPSTVVDQPKGVSMSAKQRAESQPPTALAVPGFLQSFVKDAQKSESELQGAQRFATTYFRASKRKRPDGGPQGVLEVINPLVRDEKNQPQIKVFPELNVVLLNHNLLREMRYMGGDGRMHTECVSVGPTKSGVGIGTLHDGPMACQECRALFPDGWVRNVVEFGSDQVTTKQQKCASRYQLMVLLPPEAWDDPEVPQLAMAFLPMTSVYGVLIKDEADTAERSKTLLSYPDRQDKEAHKGVLLELLTRPWATGQKYGLETKGTPFTAIGLTVRAEWLGDSTEPVPAFYIGDELDEQGLTLVESVREQGAHLTGEHIKQMVRDAYPAASATNVERMATSAVDGRWDDYGQSARLALPVHAEVVHDDPRPTPTPTATAAPTPIAQPYEDDGEAEEAAFTPATPTPAPAPAPAPTPAPAPAPAPAAVKAAASADGPKVRTSAPKVRDLEPIPVDDEFPSELELPF